MNKLKVEFQNCFGIKDFKYCFSFAISDKTKANQNNVVLYAPNGTMKTSFAKVCKYYSEGKLDLIRDEVNTNEKASFYFKDENDDDVPPDVIFVGNVDQNRLADEAISRILVSKKLKEEFDAIYSVLEKRKKDLLERLKKISKSSDCEKEFYDTFEKESEDTFYTCIERLESEILKGQNCVYDFKYNVIFDKSGKVKGFLDENAKLIKAYFEVYKNLLVESGFFHFSEKNAFGTYQASVLQKSTDDNAFFDAQHEIVLSDGKKIKSSVDLKKEISDRINEIVTDSVAKNVFDKIGKALDKNTELRDFKNLLTTNHGLIPELIDYDGFRRKVWIAYLRDPDVQGFAIALVEEFKKYKPKLQDIINKARQEVERWNEILELFRARFHVPFDINIKNSRDVVLGLSTPSLEFSYSGKRSEDKTIEKEVLLGVLSRGELRAFNILQILFEIEARKSEGRDTILVLDDISDSFDYRNKYAIIEYLSDISGLGIFKSILLTHNFDFYRTICSRLEVCSENSLILSKSNDGKIQAAKGMYRKDFFNMIVNKASKDLSFFICMIPFARNVAKFVNNEMAYEFLTNCLHYKEETKSISIGDIRGVFSDLVLGKFDAQKREEGENYLRVLYEEARKISEECTINEIVDVEKKVLLAIAIRLHVEEFMVCSLKGIEVNESFESNQTPKLIKLFREKLRPEAEVEKLLRKIQVVTPDTIHVNSFMYEPIIDMASKEFADIYCEVTKRLKL